MIATGSLFSNDRSYAQYFNDVSRAPMPENAKEERELFERYFQHGDLDARRKLIEGGLRFVVKIAKPYYRNDTDFLKTLIAAGNVGLITAVDRYRPWVIRCRQCEKNNYVATTTKRQRCTKCRRTLCKSDAKPYTTRFLTYAAWWILEAIRKEIYSVTTVHVPPYKQKEHHQARREGKDAGVSYIPYDESLDEYAVRVPTDATEDRYIDQDARRLLHKLLSQMPDREAYILISYYGLRDTPKTLREMADRLDVCSERVRQVKVDALNNLRKLLHRMKITTVQDTYAN